jgi:ADP-ribosylglycohydrolase
MASPKVSTASRITHSRPTTRSASAAKPAAKPVSRNLHKSTSKPILRSARVPAVLAAAACDAPFAKAEPRVAVVDRSEPSMEELPSTLQIGFLDEEFLFQISDD